MAMEWLLLPLKLTLCFFQFSPPSLLQSHGDEFHQSNVEFLCSEENTDIGAVLKWSVSGNVFLIISYRSLQVSNRLEGLERPFTETLEQFTGIQLMVSRQLSNTFNFLTVRVFFIY